MFTLLQSRMLPPFSSDVYFPQCSEIVKNSSQHHSLFCNGLFTVSLRQFTAHRCFDISPETGAKARLLLVYRNSVEVSILKRDLLAPLNL